MSYCTPDDLTGRYGSDELTQVTDRSSPPSGVIDVDCVQRACDDATAMVDSYARARYATPLTSTNVAVVLPHACAIARWLLHEDGHPEHVEHGYNAAVAWLRDMAAGRVGLPDATPPTPPTDGGAFGIAVNAPTPVFVPALDIGVSP